MSEPTDGPWEPPTEHDDRHDDKLLGEDPPTRPATPAEAVRARASRPPKASVDEVVLLDMVSRNAPTTHAPERNATAAGTIVVVATGADAQRIHTLCQTAPLDVPIVASLGVVHDAASVIVIGEPSPPAPSRVVHIARPTLSDDMLLALLRALTSARVVADPPTPPTTREPRLAEPAERLAAQTDHAAIERIGAEAIRAITDADRAQLLFHDPIGGALWSEAAQRTTGDARRAVAGIVGWCAQTGSAVMASPAGDDPRYLREYDDPEGKPQARLLVQPVIGGDRRVHALLVAARRWRRTDFTEAERANLRDFAALIAPALDTAALTGPRRSSTEPGVQTVSAHPAPTTAAAATPAGPVQTSTTVRSLPPMPTQPPPTEAARLKRPSVDDSRAKRPSISEPRSKRPSAEESSRSLRDSKRDSQRDSRDGIEPRDIAVIATDPVDVARVGKLAKKARLEVSVLSSTDEVPAYYRIVTIGEAWAPDSDPRIVYAARIEITDDQLSELLSGIASERAPAPLVVYKPATIVEARRLQPAFASLRTLASTGDLAEAETTAVTAIKSLLDADRAYCLYFDASDGSLWSETRERKTNDDRRAIAGVVGWAAQTGRAVNVERASADPRWLGPLDDPDGDPNSQLLVQPLVTADRRVIGVLVAARRPKRPGFTDVDVALLAQFAALATPLIEHIELAGDVQQVLSDSSAPVQVVAPPSSMERLVAGAAALPRWSYAVAGAALSVAILSIARC